jgi:ABC-type dipeptide/oligopeptide/nickel transport system permease component
VRSADYVIKRVLFAIVTVFVAITLNFIIFRAAPGDAVTGERCRNCTKEFKANLRKELGLDKSKWEQYVIYIKQLAHGDLGYSFEDKQPVAPQLWGPLKNTLPMLALGTAFSIVFGILTGVVAAWRRGTFWDRSSVLVGLGFYSLPTQWLGLMLIFFVAPMLSLPSSGISDPFLEFTDPGWWPALVDRLKHMVLPSATIGLVIYGEYTLIVRSAMLETLGEDYILTARAKGLATWTIVRKHALRNSMLPITTLIFLSLGYIVGGAILIESVFNYPGIGLLTYDAVFAKDYPIMQGAFLVLTVSVIFANYVADLLYFRLDPRITE